MKGVWSVGIGVLVLGVLLAGCGSTEMNKRTQRRLDNIQGVMDHLARNEDGRADKLGRTLDGMESQFQCDVVQAGENRQKVKSWIEDDFDNWERQKPIICRRIGKMLAGRPENIDKTLLEILD